MGAYLSEPVLDKLSSDETVDDSKLSYGGSCMQGWRISQEDAHNCIIEYDNDTSFFSVYDGHGGHEVATYCALHLPDFLKSSEAYKKGDIAQALEDAYLDFDERLASEDAVKQLKIIAGNSDKKEDASDEDEMSNLYEEATMSIDELVLRYGRKMKESGEDSGNSKKSTWSQLMSKVGSKKNRKFEEVDNEKLECEEKDQKSETEKSSPAGEQVSEVDGCLPSKLSADDTETSPKQAKQENDKICDSPTSKSSPTTESNGGLKNGSSHLDHSPNQEKAVPSSKGKGIGKGLSNSIRKAVEKTPEELERERREAERISKRLERKQSLRSKSAEELYRAMVTNTEEEDEDEETDEDADDEEDEDFEGDASSSNGDAPDEDEDDDDDDGEEDEDEEKVTATANNFSMNLKEEPGSDSGCTAVVAVIRGNRLFVANAGDSRCVLSRVGKAVPMSADHKPEDEPERSRIEKAGGVVTGDGRVNGGLNLSRALGDHAYKQNKQLSAREQMITALPDVQSIELQQGDEFIVLACDGIWNSKSNQQVVDFIRPKLLAKKLRLSQICEELFDECLAPNTMGDGTGCDNMTAIIVRLDRLIHYEGNGDAIVAVEDGTTATIEPTCQSVKRPLPEDTVPDVPGNHEDDKEHRLKEKRQRIEEEEQENDQVQSSMQV